MEPAITISKIFKTYKAGLNKKHKALSGISLKLHAGEVFGIVGPNGAGKSTLLKILMGFISMDSGSILIAGTKPGNPASHALLGYLPENPCLYENLTAKEHLQFACKIARIPAKEISDRIQHTLKLVQLSHAADAPIRRYSKGMVQRAALAFALIHAPQILILDEPMSGLDPLGRQLVGDVIRDCRQRKRSVLFCSHILTDVERICDRIGIMHKGQLITTTSPEQLSKMPMTSKSTPLESLFLSTVSGQPGC